MSSYIAFFTVHSVRTGRWLQKFGDSGAAIAFMREQKDLVCLTINQPGDIPTMNTEENTDLEEGAVAPAKTKKGGRKKDPNAVKAPTEPKEPTPRGEGKLVTVRALLETYRDRIADGDIIRKDVINELVENHGVNRGTANVQYGVVFGTTPRVPKEEQAA